MDERQSSQQEKAPSQTETEREEQREDEETIDEPQPWAKASPGSDPED